MMSLQVKVGRDYVGMGAVELTAELGSSTYQIRCPADLLPKINETLDLIATGRFDLVQLFQLPATLVEAI